ncbi:hypothetical protein L1049_017180 [Liquidambar formosana]|uniref:Acid phosphatase 1 n=1 Tax=Liquidambar formosana TaxID=63359 RepID=A0AAP0S1D1_LIQFO
MGKNLGALLAFLSLFTGVTVADWNILNKKTKSGFKISLKNYCESWRMNVELNNIRGLEVVPEECIEYIGKYVKSTQYKVDSERAIEECTVYLSTSCTLKRDSRDAWIFDIDDTLLSTVPYYEEHNFRARPPALDHSLRLFNEMKARGVQIILVSSRREHLRSATVDNLVNVGYHGVLATSIRKSKKYKADTRKQLIGGGYRIWGIVGDQWSSFEELPSVERTFKLSNSLYYVS